MTMRKALISLLTPKPQEDSSTGPSWKYRRKLIYRAYWLGFGMIAFGAATFLMDQWGVGVTLITGGVSLISIILTAYTAFGTFEDVKLYTPNEEMEP
jgi:polyferredoxin